MSHRAKTPAAIELTQPCDANRIDAGSCLHDVCRHTSIRMGLVAHWQHDDAPWKTRIGPAPRRQGVGRRRPSQQQCSGVLVQRGNIDPTTGSWTTTGSMATAREGFTLTLLPNGKVLAAGGWAGNNPFCSAELTIRRQGLGSPPARCTNVEISMMQFS